MAGSVLTEEFSQSIVDRQTDFVKLAEAYGALGFNLTSQEDVDALLSSALEAANKSKRPAVVNCEIDPEEKVFHFIPPGGAIDDPIMGVNK